MRPASLSGFTLLLALLPLAPRLRAQTAEPARVVEPGRVLATDGTPVADAAVVVVAPGEHGGLVPGDVVRATSDASGRFRVALQPARRYVAWASVARGDDTFVSARTDAGGAMIELTMTPEPVSKHGRLEETAAWQGHGPLRIRLDVHDCAELAVTAALDADGRFPLPPLPPGAYPVRVFCGDTLIHAKTIDPRRREQLPPPRRLRLRAADETGAPVAGAVVHRVVCQEPMPTGPFPVRPHVERVPVATTDDNGMARVLLAADHELLGPTTRERQEPMLFVATKHGHLDGIAGREQELFTNGRLLSEQEVARTALPFLLPRVPAPSAAIVAPAGAKAPVVRWIGSHRVPSSRDAHTMMADGGVLPVVEGKVMLPHAPTGASDIALEVLVDLPALPAEDPWAKLRRPMALPVSRAHASRAGAIDLREVLPLRLLVVDATGGPAIHASVLAAPLASESPGTPAHALHVATDRTGRALLPALPGPWLVAVSHGTGFVLAEVDVQPGLPPQTLTLDALPRMRVLVRDGDGKPVADARFDSGGAAWDHLVSSKAEWQRAVAWTLTRWSLQQARSDADGRADLHFLPVEGMRAARLQATHGMRMSRLQELTAGDDPVVMTLR